MFSPKRKENGPRGFKWQFNFGWICHGLWYIQVIIVYISVCIIYEVTCNFDMYYVHKILCVDNGYHGGIKIGLYQIKVYIDSWYLKKNYMCIQYKY